MVAFPHHDPKAPSDLPQNVKVLSAPGQVIVLRKFSDVLDLVGERTEMAYGILSYEPIKDVAMIWHIEVPRRENRRKGYGSEIVKSAKHMFDTVLVGASNGQGEALLRKNGFELLQGPLTGDLPVLGYTTVVMEGEDETTRKEGAGEDDGAGDSAAQRDSDTPDGDPEP